MRIQRALWPTLLTAVALLVAATSSPAATSCVERLQVLLPGMTPLPNNPGYTGAPLPQVVGIPFGAIVNLRDQSWDPCSNNTTAHTVQLSSTTDANISFPAGATASFAQSQTYSVIFGTAGNMTLTASDLSHPTVGPTTCPPALVQVLSTFTTSQIGQSGTNPLAVTAGVPFPVSVWARDPAGAIVAGYKGTADLDELASNGTGTASPASASFSQGTWSGQASLYRADTNTAGGVGHAYLRISASEVTAIGLSNAVVVNAGALDRLQILVPGETPNPGVQVSGAFPGKIGWPQSQISGIPFQVRVTATDAYWNLVGGVTDAVYFSSTDGGASLPATTPGAAIPLGNSQGIFSVTLNAVGLQTISVHDATNGAISSGTSAQVNVLAPGSTPSSSPTPLPATATPTPIPGSPTPTPPPATATPPAPIPTPTPAATQGPVPTPTAIPVEAVQAPIGSFWNQPNPFAAGREVTTLVFVLGAAGNTTIRIHDPLGHRVGELRFAAGSSGGAAGVNRVAWSGLDAHARALPPGAYVASLTSSNGGRPLTAARTLAIRP